MGDGGKGSSRNGGSTKTATEPTRIKLQLYKYVIYDNNCIKQ